MARILKVHLLPKLTTPQELAGGTVVAIDVLRATTTIVHALAAGAKQVIPCLEINEARDLASRVHRGSLLGGERRGLRIDGFDLGNSPSEYTRERVAGKTIVMTTTNGTSALMYATGASHVLIGAFVNLSAVCARLADSADIHLLCAGTRGEITREDTLLAGAIVERFSRLEPQHIDLNDQAMIAAEAWNCVAGDGVTRVELTEALRETQGGRNVAGIGHVADIETAAHMDKFDVVPELILADWAIRVL